MNLPLPLGNLEESEDFGGSYVVYCLRIHVVDRDSLSKNCQHQLSTLHLESIAIATDVFLEPNGICSWNVANCQRLQSCPPQEEVQTLAHDFMKDAVSSHLLLRHVVGCDESYET